MCLMIVDCGPDGVMWRLWPWEFFIYVLGILQSIVQEATQDATQQADTHVRRCGGSNFAVGSMLQAQAFVVAPQEDPGGRLRRTLPAGQWGIQRRDPVGESAGWRLFFEGHQQEGPTGRLRRATHRVIVGASAEGSCDSGGRTLRGDSAGRRTWETEVEARA